MHFEGCTCGCEERPRERRMFRGDTLYFVDVLYANPTTNQIKAIPYGDPPPPGFGIMSLVGVQITFTAKFYVQNYDNQAVSRLDNGSIGGIATTSPASGIFSVTMPALATQGFPDGPVTLATSIQITDSAGRVTTVEDLPLVVEPSAV